MAIYGSSFVTTYIGTNYMKREKKKEKRK